MDRRATAGHRRVAAAEARQAPDLLPVVAAATTRLHPRKSRSLGFQVASSLQPPTVSEADDDAVTFLPALPLGVQAGTSVPIVYISMALPDTPAVVTSGNLRL